MIQFIRNRSKFVLWAVVVVVVVFFSFWGTLGPDDLARVQKVGKLAGQPVTRDQFRSRLGEMELVMGLFSGMPFNMDMGRDFAVEQTWHRLMLMYEARVMGLRVSDREKGRILATHPMFRAEAGGFDTNRYERFVRETLPRYRVDQQRFDELLGEEILTRRTAALLTAGAHVPTPQVRHAAERLFAEATVWMVEFKADGSLAGAAPTEEELRAAFDSQQERFRSPERRRVEFVRFALKAQDRALADEERKKKFQQLGEAAVNFSVGLYGEEGKPQPNFGAEALKQQLAIEKTGWFTTEEPPAGIENAQDFAKAAFLLTPEQPHSDAVGGTNEVYVLKIEATEAPQPLAFEAVRDKITAELKQRKAVEAAFKTGGEARQKLADGLKQGRPIDELMASLGAHARKITGLVPASETQATDPAENQLRALVSRLDTGELSQIRSQGGSVSFAFVATRKPPANIADRLSAVRSRMLEERREQIMREWLAQFMRRPDTLLGGMQQQDGGG